MICYFIVLSSILLLISTGILLYVWYAKIPVLESQLSNCLIIHKHLDILKKLGPLGYMARHALITHAIDNKEKLYEAGEVDKQQIEALPQTHLTWLRTSNKLSSVSLAILLISTVLIKFNE